ncbi:hypothetical protein [Nocardioides sp. 616]|uniref:hypothetical protein n=1 Tax=Nocardioides sp. 616 TaxID=2268090 RepID=UPI000CE5440F|nr:hypothetical protein [Nocardioides sp. 616]
MRRLEVGLGAFGVSVLAIVVFVNVFRGGIADGYDHLIDAAGGSSRAAALVGWAAGFAFVAWVGVALLVPRMIWHVWFCVVSLVLFVPFMSLQPSRSRRSAEVESDLWFLGSFFDTYNNAIVVAVLALLVGMGALYLSTREGGRADFWVAASGKMPAVILLGGTVATLIQAVAFV